MIRNIDLTLQGMNPHVLHGVNWSTRVVHCAHHGFPRGNRKCPRNKRCTDASLIQNDDATQTQVSRVLPWFHKGKSGSTALLLTPTGATEVTHCKQVGHSCKWNCIAWAWAVSRWFHYRCTCKLLERHRRFGYSQTSHGSSVWKV